MMIVFTQVMITTVSGPTFPEKFQVIGTNLGQLWWKLAPDSHQILPKNGHKLTIIETTDNFAPRETIKIFLNHYVLWTTLKPTR